MVSPKIKCSRLCGIAAIVPRLVVCEKRNRHLNSLIKKGGGNRTEEALENQSILRVNRGRHKGVSKREDRPRYRALLATARKRQIDVALVWWYDQSARSTQPLVCAPKEFHSLGVDFISLSGKHRHHDATG
jgi:DNA invertase Pin-like site-specific DNA recombinase